MSIKVVVGLPGNYILPGEQSDVYVTKIGGCPVLPPQCGRDLFDTAICGVCGSPLALALQTHAPLKRGQLRQDCPERWLFVFGCVRKGCGKEKQCWRAFRVQLDPAVASSRTETMPNRSVMSSSIHQEGDQETAEVSPAPEASFSLEGLKQALESASNKKRKKAPRKRGNSSPGIGGNGVMVGREALLPEFYVYADSELSIKGNDDSEAMDSRIQSLIERYEGAVEENEGTSWKGEAYEKADYKAADDGAFWRFQQCLQACPQQCVRYGFQAVLLNPTNTPFRPSFCQKCGSKRVYEMQLMPHFISAIYEAAGWFQSETALSENANIQKAIHSAHTCFMEWDWSSIAVYTCSQSCGTFGNEFIEEQVVMF